jgi:hypothetical protein
VAEEVLVVVAVEEAAAAGSRDTMLPDKAHQALSLNAMIPLINFK